jgi:hypothetical protein
MARWPTEFPHASPHGKYGHLRRNPKEGQCGVKAYPCRHNAIDLVASEGTEVYAPEDGTIAAVSRGVLPPFRKYGPGVILFKGRSGVYHLLAHLHYDSLPEAFKPMEWEDYWEDGLIYAKPDRATVKEGQLIGRVSSKNHVHWEVREGEHGARSNPAIWLKKQTGILPAGAKLADFTYDAAPVAGGGGGAGVLLLVAAVLLLGDSKGSR